MIGEAMMSKTDLDMQLDSTLLELHLGHLSEAESDALTARIEREPALASQHEALGAMFAALSTLADEPAPAGLRERISARVAAAPMRLARPRPAEPVPPDPDASFGPIRIYHFRDILAVAAMIVLAVGVGVPSALHLRERNHRIACAANLAEVGRGVQAYAMVFNENLPFAGWSQRASWQPTDEPGVQTLPNRRHVFPLLARGLVSPEAFVCPSSNDVPMPASEVTRRSDFLESRNVSYAYQNMAGVRPSLRSDARLPILSDDNPLFDDGLPLLDLRRITRGSPAESNSDAHGGAGQNILTLDGSSIWVTTPFSGVGGDNIWMLERVMDYTGREGPQTATDSHLIK